MKAIFSILISISAAIVYVGHALNEGIPKPVPSAVIATKSQEGGQFAVVLPEKITDKQHRLLEYAKAVAIKDGHPPELLQGVLLQETHAGGLKVYRVANSEGTPYYGVMQIKMVAAKEVLKRWPQLYKQYGFQTFTDDEIKANLILNDQFNIAVGSKYLKHLKNAYGYSGRTLVNAYNRGPTGVKSVGDDYHYAIGAERKVASLR